jgi:hypothetical protein
MLDKITGTLNKILSSCLSVINFKGSAYINLWSLSLLVLSLWVCIKTRSIPVSVSMIFSSIIIAYGAHKVSKNLGSKGQENGNSGNSKNDSN